MAEEQTKVRIRAVSRMTDPQGETNEIQSARRGTLTRADGHISIEYDEERDGEKARITLESDGSGARMRRRGLTSAQLDFEPGKRTHSAYITMYGEIPVAVQTENVTLEEDAAGGTLRLEYDVFVGGERTARTRFELTWRA